MTINIDNVSKVYTIVDREPGLKGTIKSLLHQKTKEIHAVNNLNLHFDTNKIVGVIGKNGSGKSTTFKLLTGLLYPSCGEITINGFIPTERKVEFLKQISFVMGQRGQLKWDLPPQDSFELLMDIYQLDYSETNKYIKDLSEKLNVSDILMQPVRLLSLGQRMKCELIASLLHKPQLLILDEPTIGLDFESSLAIRKIIKEEAENKKMMVFLSSHILDDIQELCNDLVILHRGQVIYNDSLQNCFEKFVTKKIISIRVKEMDVMNRIDELGIDRDSIIEKTENMISLLVDRHKTVHVATDLMKKCRIDDIEIKEQPLDQVIGMITNR